MSQLYKKDADKENEIVKGKGVVKLSRFSKGQ